MADEKYKFNPSKLVRHDNNSEYTIPIIEGPVTEVADDKKPKRGRPKKNANTPAVKQQQIPVPASSMSYIQENIPYTSLYTESNSQIDEAINALNILGNQTINDLQTIRASKTFKNKYNTINELTMTATNIINSKISAIKEKNSTATQASRFELDRMKTLKSNANEEDDNMRIANLYDAFVNTPIGMGQGPILGPSMQDMILQNPNADFNRMQMGMDDQAWEQSLDPATNRMVLEAKGAIDTVVYYNASSGDRWYEVLDRTTRTPVPNVEKPDASTLYDLDIKINEGIAKDTNRGISYPLIVVGGEMTDMSAY